MNFVDQGGGNDRLYKLLDCDYKDTKVAIS